MAEVHNRRSNDNPYSEAQFKTLKYRPDVPDAFGVQGRRRLLPLDLRLVQNEHRHLGLGPLTPADVHYDHAQEVVMHRQQVLATAREANPMRFRRPQAPNPVAREVWTNRPEPGVVLVGSPTTA